MGNNDSDSNISTFSLPSPLQSHELSSTSNSLLSPISPILPYHFNTHRIPSHPEYLFQIDTSKSRPFTLRLTYITGSGYLTGLAFGGLWGIAEGFFTILKLREASRKVNLTAMLNSITRRGPFFGNTLGILSMYFAMSEQILRKLRNREDNINKIVAGFTAGAIWRCSKSLRALTLAGAIGGSLVGSYYLFHV